MEITDLSFRDLSYVLALAQYQHFGKAAEACSVSQPALSKQIRQIEQWVGHPLFERTRRQVSLTGAGERFVAQAQQLMDVGQALAHSMKAHTSPLSGHYRLGIIASSCPYVLPHLIPNLSQHYPQLTLTLHEGLTDILINKLLRGELDMVMAARTLTDESAFRVYPLYFEPFVLAVATEEANHYSSPVFLPSLDTQRLLLLEDGHCLKDQTLSLCQMPENRLSQNFRATSVETLIQMTATGLGISVLPILATLPAAIPTERLRFIPLQVSPDQPPGRDMVLYVRKTAPFQEDSQHFQQYIQSCLSHQPVTCG